MKWSLIGQKLIGNNSSFDAKDIRLDFRRLPGPVWLVIEPTRILEMKINLILEHHKPMFSLFDVIIFWYNGIIEQKQYLGYDFQWAIFEIIASLD